MVELMFVLGGVLLAITIALVVLVLLQQGKEKSLSGAIAGGSDNFYGKNKTADKNKIMSIATGVLAVVFVGIVIAMYLLF